MENCSFNLPDVDTFAKRFFTFLSRCRHDVNHSRRISCSVVKNYTLLIGHAYTCSRHHIKRIRLLHLVQALNKNTKTINVEKKTSKRLDRIVFANKRVKGRKILKVLEQIVKSLISTSFQNKPRKARDEIYKAVAPLVAFLTFSTIQSLCITLPLCLGAHKTLTNETLFYCSASFNAEKLFS